MRMGFLLKSFIAGEPIIIRICQSYMCKRVIRSKYRRYADSALTYINGIQQYAGFALQSKTCVFFKGLPEGKNIN